MEEQEGLKFYRCNTCGNLLFVMVDPNVRPTCCGSEMEILDHVHGDEGREKHEPVIEINTNDTGVQVGLQLHPMEPVHRIEWIALTDGERVEIQKLGLTTPPTVKFSKMKDDGKLRAYAFCNIHGLWQSEK